jgi:hypothetical protein
MLAISHPVRTRTRQGDIGEQQAASEDDRGRVIAAILM